MKIIVDTNIVFSALLNSESRIGQLLLNSHNHFKFYSCKYLQRELFKHLSKIRSYTKLNDNDLFELLQLIESRIFFIDEELLPAETIAMAKTIVSEIDFNDFAFVALTNYLNGLLWTGDKALISGLKRKNYTQVTTTMEMWILLEKLEMK
jgi:predicted nucleic acid-binding protein